MQLNINVDKVVVFTNKLEKMHRSGLPLAIRGALNKAAFDVKQHTMPASAAKSFEQRQPNFFKANSRVDMAKGFNVDGMIATVGFISTSLKGGNNFAVKDLEQQEHGGTIKGKSFIPTDVARGGNKKRPVRPSNRLSKIKKVVNASNATGRNEKEKFIKSAVYAGKGGFVIGNRPKKMLLKINSIKRVDNKTVIKSTASYSFEKKRNVHVPQTGFMKKASLKSANKLELFYIAEAERQIKRLMNK